MTAKEKLRMLGRMELYIHSKKERLAVLKEMSRTVSSSKFDDMPKSSNRGRSKLEETVLKCIDLEKEIKEDEERLENEKLIILELIGRIPEPEYQTVLISRYFKHKSWEDIANGLFYTKRWIYSLHGKALESLEEKILQSGKDFT